MVLDVHITAMGVKSDRDRGVEPVWPPPVQFLKQRQIQNCAEDDVTDV